MRGVSQIGHDSLQKIPVGFSMHREHAVVGLSACTTVDRSARTVQAASWQQGPAAAHPQAAWPRCVSTHSTGSPLRVTTRSLSSAVACKKVACPCCCPIFRLRGHATSTRLSPCPRCSLLSFSVATLLALTLQRADAVLFDACGVGPLNVSEVQRRTPYMAGWLIRAKARAATQNIMHA